MIAETGRLILRRYRENDLQDLYEYLSDPEVVAYEPYKPMTLGEDIRFYTQRCGFTLAGEETDSSVKVARLVKHR